MRYVLSMFLVCALGAPAASALPIGASSVSPSNADMVVAVAKRSSGAKTASNSSKTTRSTKSKKDDGGIHPLVGSGDY